jgi:stage V sporulation protein R
MRFIRSLPVYLQEIIEEIRETAIGYDLDFFETIFEMVDYKQINEFAAYGGFPTRYPHWRFGMEYEQLSKGSEYGLSKIYEMVINNDPAYAYLMEGNNLVDQKTVIAHVYAHVDFFKNNYYFSKTNRNMVDEMANHAARIRRYIDREGIEEVEDFIDTCLSLDNLIDYHRPYIEREPDEEQLEEMPDEIPKFDAKQYMDEYINPEEFIEEQKRKLEEEAKKADQIPTEPQQDVLMFLLDHAPLDRWQQDVLSIIREEAYYLAPQGMTKIMNEGWASYWHSKMMTNDILDDSEIIDFADIHSKVVSGGGGGFNPYKLGLELYRDIEERWNKGKFGKEWREIDDLDRKASWDRQVGMGREKIFEVRRLYNDVMFIDEFLTEEFVKKNKLYTFGYNSKSNTWEIESRQFNDVKNKLLDQLTNFGQPFIFVKDGNYKNRGELLLHHRFDGTELKMDYAEPVLESLHNIWQRPVNIETKVNDEGILLSFDGDGHDRTSIEYERLSG